MKMKKRFLATLLCLCMAVTLFPTTAFAADGGTLYFRNDTLCTDAAGTNEYPIGKDITWDVYNDMGTGQKTLVFNNFHYTSSDPVGLDISEPITINLVGQNSITAGAGTGASSYGLKADCSLNITGPGGTLTLQGGNTTGRGVSYGFYVGNDLTVTDATLIGNGGQSAAGSYGGLVDSGDAQIRGHLRCTGGGCNGDSVGLAADTITVSNSSGDPYTLTCTGGDATDASYGIIAIRLENHGTLSATAGSVDDKATSLSSGIFAANELTNKTTGKLTAVSNNASPSARTAGILMVQGTFIVEGGSVLVQAPGLKAGGMKSCAPLKC